MNLLRHSGFLLLSVLMFCFPAYCRGRRVAIVVGVGTYPPEAKLDKLHGDVDAKLISDALRSLGWDVHELGNDLASPPDRQEITDELGISERNGHFEYAPPPFLSNLGANDTVLFFFSGHGLKSDDGSDYIIPRDARRVDEETFAKKTLLGIMQVQNALLKTGAGSIILVSDACRSTAYTKSTQPVGARLKPWSRSAIAIPDQGDVAFSPNASTHVYMLFSSFDNESREIPGQNGVFSYYLAQALSPAGMDRALSKGNNCLTLTDWFTYAKNNTVIYVRDNFGGDKQEPEPLTNDEMWARSYCMADSGGDYAPLHALLDRLWVKGQQQGQPWSDIYVTQKLLRLNSCTLSVRTENFERRSQTWSGKDTSLLTETTVHLDLIREVKRYSYGEGDGAVERIDLNGPKEAFDSRGTLRILAPGDRTVESQIDTSPSGSMFPTSLVLNFPPNDHVDASKASTLLSNIVDSCRNR